MLEKAYELTGRENVVLTGGFFLNCIANYQLLKSGINLYVDPLAYDGGLAIGSALLEHYENTLSRS
jgi:carbamoyltransferase